MYHQVMTDRKSEVAIKKKFMRLVRLLTIMLLYSSSNMSRKISSPCRKRKISGKICHNRHHYYLSNDWGLLEKMDQICNIKF